MLETNLSILIPTRSRIESLKNTLESIKQSVSNIYNIEIILGVDKDDDSTINYYKQLNKTKIKIKICLLDRKNGYTEHAWRFYEMAKIAEGKMFLTFADDLIINTKNWDIILFKKIRDFPKDNIFISYTSHNQINYDWPLIQIITKEWIEITKKFSNCFEADTELMIIGTLLKRLFKIEEINVSHFQNKEDKTYIEGRKKVINNKVSLKNSIFRLKSLYRIFKDYENLFDVINNKNRSNIIKKITILFLFLPRLIWIFKKFKINFFKVLLKNILFRN